MNRHSAGPRTSGRAPGRPVWGPRRRGPGSFGSDCTPLAINVVHTDPGGRVTATVGSGPRLHARWKVRGLCHLINVVVFKHLSVLAAPSSLKRGFEDGQFSDQNKRPHFDGPPEVAIKVRFLIFDFF